jgi:transcription initiation factor TFIIB
MDQVNTVPVTVRIDHIITKLTRIARLDAKSEKLAIEIAHKSNDHILGKSPNGLAVAYLYLAAILLGANLLQIDLPHLAGVTEVTVRNRCKDMLSGFKLTIKVQLL